MKKNVCRVFALVLLVSMVLGLAACSNASKPGANEPVQLSLVFDPDSPFAQALMNGNAGGSAAPAASGGAAATPAATPAASSDTSATPAASSDTSATPAASSDTSATPAASADTPAASGDSSAAPAASANPSTPADILARYTKVMDNTKATIQGYQKQEWQELSSLELGALSSIIEGIAQGFITTRDKAEVQQRTEAENIPPKDATHGCLLTDASAIKTATYEDLGGGKAKITIVLNDEKDPEPAANGVSPSKVGGIFPCMSRADIMDTLSGISAIKVNSFELNYSDCKVELTFDSNNDQAAEMNYFMPVKIAANAKAAIITLDVKGVLTDYVEIRNMTY